MRTQLIAAGRIQWRNTNTDTVPLILKRSAGPMSARFRVDMKIAWPTVVTCKPTFADAERGDKRTSAKATRKLDDGKNS